MDEFLSSKELFAPVEVMIVARAFSKDERLELTSKLKKYAPPEDRQKLSGLIYHYCEVKRDCRSIQDYLWQLMNCIADKREISIDYYRVDRKWVTHRLRPASVMFTNRYFYLIAFLTAGKPKSPTTSA